MTKQEIFNGISKLSSPTRLRIFKIISDSKKPITISEINRKLPDYNYRTIWQHIKSLEEAKLVKSKKENHQTGKPVAIDLTDLAMSIVDLGILVSLGGKK